MNIHIDKRPFSVSEYYGGEFRENGITYKFTLASYDTGAEVTWIDDVKPNDHEKVEQEIIKQFAAR